jgi:hypothetical protein
MSNYASLNRFHNPLTDRLVPREAGRAIERLFKFNRNIPSCVVSTADDVSIPPNVFSTIPFDMVEHDTDGMFSPQVSPTQLTVRTPGLWLVAFTTVFAASAETTMNREVRCFRNRQEEVIQASMTIDNSIDGPSRAFMLMLEEGEFLELDIFITSASTSSQTLIPPFMGMMLVASPGLEALP